MRKVLIAILSSALLLVSVAPVFAHGGEEDVGAQDAQTLVKQAIAFLEGIQDTGTAAVKATQALKIADSSVDKAKLQQAVSALNKPDLEQAKELLVESIGQDPKSSDVLSLKPASPPPGATTVITILSIAFIVLGGAIVLKVKGSH